MINVLEMLGFERPLRLTSPALHPYLGVFQFSSLSLSTALETDFTSNLKASIRSLNRSEIMLHSSVSATAELCKILDVKEIRKFESDITNLDFSLFSVS